MEFNELIRARYSCKKYDSRPVDRQALSVILEAGRLAPTARNAQVQRIYVLESEEALAKFDEASPCRYGAPTVLVVAYYVNDAYVYPSGTMDSGAEDAAIVATHLMLAAKNEGVESCWLNKIEPEKLAASLNLPDSEKVVLALDLGYAAEDAGPLPNHFKRKDLSETTFYL